MLSKIEQRKAVRNYWSSQGYNASNIDKMSDSNIFALYKKYQSAIEKQKGRTVKYDAYSTTTTERDYWSDKEWGDYAFEERDDD